MKIWSTREAAFPREFERIMNRRSVRSARAEAAVRRIIRSVREEGDTGLASCVRKYDGVRLAPRRFEVPRAEWEKAWESIPRPEREAIRVAAGRIREFHRRGIPRGISVRSPGMHCESRLIPLERVGVYVPGGKYGYPSTVLMSVVPARVAGVKEIILASPCKKSGVNPYVLAAARVAGASRVFGIGGAQAVAALACGTETVPRVDKIVGPGNIYVATAKRLLFGEVGIDSIAGPSEVIVVGDGSAPPEYLAAELLAQAEHDEEAVALMLSTSREELDRVEQELRQKLKGSPGSPAAKSLRRNGRLILAAGLGEAIELVNRFAPEHLVLVVRNPEQSLKQVRNAGAVLLGADSAVAFGDYLAGPSHVLPTGGSARFLSPLGVEDFFRRSSVIRVEGKGVTTWGKAVVNLARIEGMERHAEAVEIRMKRTKGPARRSNK